MTNKASPLGEIPRKLPGPHRSLRPGTSGGYASPSSDLPWIPDGFKLSTSRQVHSSALTAALLLFNQIFKIFKVRKDQNIFAKGLRCHVTTWAAILHQQIQSLSTPTRDAIPQTPTAEHPRRAPSSSLVSPSHLCLVPAKPPLHPPLSRQEAVPPRSSREMSSSQELQTPGNLLVHARGSAPPGCVPVSLCPCAPPAAEPTCHPEPALASNSSLCSVGPRTTGHCGQLPGAGSSLALGDVPSSSRVWGCSAQLVTKSALFAAPREKADFWSVR